MIEQLVRQIRDGRQVREALICLRKEIKKEEERQSFVLAAGEDCDFLKEFLDDEDPKVRRNAALILGEMQVQSALPLLLEKYLAEDTLFVRSDYVKAMEHLDCGAVLDALKEQMEKLDGAELTDETRKHVTEERNALRRLLLAYETPGRHVFCGYDTVSEVLLVTNREQPQVTRAQIHTGTVTPLSLGLRVSGPDLHELMQIRTWSEMLFPIPGARALSGSVREIARKILAMKTVEYLERLHEEGGSFYFRLEVKGPMEPAAKSDFVKRLCAALEEESRGRLRNAAGAYEVEIRMLLRRDGSWLPMLKLYTLPDERFTYRKESIAASIAPVNAALTVELARPWLHEGAQVLDPFCGVGTMLIERKRAMPADPLYGVDIFGEAIEKARQNADAAGCKVWFVNRDFFDFTHDYLFDEIITDMPRPEKGSDEEAALQLCTRFLEKADTHLRTGGVIAAYSPYPRQLEKAALAGKVWECRGVYPLNEKSGAGVVIVTKTRAADPETK